MEEYFSVIKSSPLFSSINEDEIKAILSCLDVRTTSYKKDEFILRFGESIKAVGIVLFGRALITQEDIWGNRNIVSTLRTGETFGTAYASTGMKAVNVSIIAECDTTVMYLPINKILSMCPSACTFHTALIRNLLKETCRKNLKFSDKITHMSQRTTRAKILSYLSSEAQQNNAFEFDIPFSRQGMADYLSVERSGLSVELGKLKKEGLIDYEGKHFVVIKKSFD